MTANIAPALEPVNPIPPGFPLVVDLDGTLTPTDTLAESLVELARRRPDRIVGLLVALSRGRLALKRYVAEYVELDVQTLPWRADLLAYLQDQRGSGRRIVLATAADESIAVAVYEHLGIFDDLLASDRHRNLKGAAKLQAIRELLGEDFVYVGDSTADLPIWKGARAAIPVNVRPPLLQLVREAAPLEREFTYVRPSLSVWLRAMRVHQWLKNTLVFVPLVVAFSMVSAHQFAQAVMAFLAFSLVASATYIGNDIWDLGSDRRHPRKCLRPLASGALPLTAALPMAGILMLAGLGIGFTVGEAFFAWLSAYIFLTTAYSWALKRYVLIDVITLSMLYTLRVIAGAVAVQLPLSHWLLAFSAFVFLSLALVKRCSELVGLIQAGKDATGGRDYRTHDLVVLWPLGTGAALASIVVFCLFINAPETQERYRTPTLLWLVALGLTYWLSRLWIKTSRGEMHDDPIIYALRDGASRKLIAAMAIIAVVAHVGLPWAAP